VAFLPGAVPDESTFTAGASPLTPVGGVWNDALAALTAGQTGELRITEKRAAHVNLRNETGTEIGTAAAPVRTDPTGTTKQPVTLFDSAGTAITLSGGRLLVDGSGVTQPISAASLPLPTGASTAAKQPALGTAGTPSADVITVQGHALMTALDVNVVGGGGGGVSAVDESAWTAGTSVLTPDGGVFNDSAAALTSGQQGTGRQTPNRARHVNLRNQAGTEFGTAANPLAANGLVTYSGDVAKPAYVGNKTTNVDATAGTSGTLIPALAGHYIYITAVQLVVQIDVTKAVAGDWAVLTHDGSSIPWFNRLFVPTAFTAPGFGTAALNFSSPAGYFYNSPNINTAVTWSSTGALLSGGATLLVWYGYTTELF
jgi:hypothetical protein